MIAGCRGNPLMRDGLPDIPAGPAIPGLPYLYTSGLLLFKEEVGDLQKIIEAESQDDSNPEKHPVLICRSCNHKITSEDRKIEISGSHRHTFFNPAGIVYELGCFSNAPGCAVLGELSAEFSWFPGFLWKVALCSKCGVHMGWQFQSGDLYFYGLILLQLQSGF